MIKTTEDVDWIAVEKHYSHYSPQELEEMTYPKKHHGHSFAESWDSHRQFQNIQFD